MLAATGVATLAVQDRNLNKLRILHLENAQFMVTIGDGTVFRFGCSSAGNLVDA